MVGMDLNKEGDIVIMKKNSKTNNINNLESTVFINSKSEMVRTDVGNLEEIEEIEEIE